MGIELKQRKKDARIQAKEKINTLCEGVRQGDHVGKQKSNKMEETKLVNSFLTKVFPKDCLEKVNLW